MKTKTEFPKVIKLPRWHSTPELENQREELDILSKASEEICIEGVDTICREDSKHLRLLFSIPSQKFNLGDIIMITKIR